MAEKCLEKDNVGWAEKLNKNSEWYKKKHPVVGIQEHPIFEEKKISIWQIILNKIKKFFLLPK